MSTLLADDTFMLLMTGVVHPKATEWTSSNNYGDSFGQSLCFANTPKKVVIGPNTGIHGDESSDEGF